MPLPEKTLRVWSHPLCLTHVPPLGHPDTPGRLRMLLEAAEEGAAGRWLVERQVALPPEEDILGVLAWNHDSEYVARLREASRAGELQLDSPDSPLSEGTYDAALAAAGVTIQAALEMVNRRLWRAFLAVRPPASHADGRRARGFCFFNHVALAAEVIVRAWSRPVVVVDFDAHHGDGTQGLFAARADVGYVSVHQYPGFPGTGTGDDIGSGEGAGTTRNVPLTSGAGDDLVATAVEEALQEVGSRLQPVALVVSAGFDGHRDDPLSELDMTDAGYRRITSALVRAAERWCEGRILSVLEGGFVPSTLARSAVAHLEELAD